MSIANDELKALQDEIIKFLDSCNAPQDPEVLVEHFINQDKDIEAIKSAIWRMVNKKFIEFTNDWKLRHIPANELVSA